MTTNTSFAIKTEVFEGPLDLLLDLIEKRKLLINDISLASVTDEYMEYVSLLQEGRIQKTSDFVVVASTLLLIKSKSLLPVLQLTEDEEENIEDLEYRLQLHRLFRDIGISVQEMYGKKMLYERTFIPSEVPLFLTDSYTTISALHTALEETLHRLPKKIVKPNVAVMKVISLEEMIEKLKVRVEQQLKLKFHSFTGAKSERATVIVSFLAVLELVKQGMVLVRQSERFSDFEIEGEAVDAPKYL